MSVKFFVLIFITNIVFSQDKDYSDSSFFPNHQEYNLFSATFSANADLPSSVSGFSIGGSIEFGMNLANFFKDDLLFSFFGGLSIMSVSTYQDNFLDALKKNITNDPNALISNNSNSFSYESAFDELNHITNNNITAKANLYYGIILKLPYRYFPIIKLYKTKKSLFGSEKNRPVGIIVYNPDTSNPYTKLAGNFELDGFGFEVDLFTQSIQHTGILGNFKIGQLSLYVEWYDIEELKLGKDSDSDAFIETTKIKLSKLLKDDSNLFNNYKREFRIGIKYGISLL